MNEAETVIGVVRQIFPQSKGYAVYVGRDDGRPEDRRFSAFGDCPFKVGERIRFTVAEKPGKDGTMFYNMVGLKPAEPNAIVETLAAAQAKLSDKPGGNKDRQIARAVAWKAAAQLHSGQLGKDPERAQDWTALMATMLAIYADLVAV